jgi:nickel transport protein
VSFFVPSAYCHELLYETTQGDAFVLRLFFSDGTPFSYENYEIIREGENIPFQTGRSDANGRIVFLPDKAGSWRINVFSEDGHGLTITVETSESGALHNTDRPLGNRYDRLIVGVAIIFGLFGLLSLYFRRSGT